MGSATHTIPELDRKGLREFGLVTAGIVIGLFGLLLPWLFSLSYPRWPWGLGVILGLWGLAAPETLRPVYKTWMRIGLMLSRITTPLILGIVYFLVVVPVGFIMRLLRQDPMARGLDDKIPSFRVTSRKAPKEQMEKPY